jgi:acetyl-CoA carboxylase carboxyltransferase component
MEHKMGTQDKITELEKLRQQALSGGGAKRIEGQHNKGKLSARERIELLFDSGTFEEIDTIRCIILLQKRWGLK